MISYNSVIQHADKKNFKEGTPNIFRFRNGTFIFSYQAILTFNSQFDPFLFCLVSWKPSISTIKCNIDNVVSLLVFTP